jgi:hypothetical protein
MYDALNKAKLYSVDALIGGYRVHAGQLSFQDMEANHRIHDEYIAAELARDPGLRSVKLFRRLSKFAQSIPKLRGLWNRTALRALYRLPGPDLPPVVRFDWGRWKL